MPWEGFEVVWFECLGDHHAALKVIRIDGGGTKWMRFRRGRGVSRR